MATTVLARVAGLVLFLFALGVFSQTGYLFLVTLFFGGDASAIAPLLVLTLKVATISLASVTVFSGLDPDRLSNGLLWYGCPERLSFSISYSYRMLPMLMEEFQNVLLSYRLRGNPPAHDTLMGKVRYLIYQVKVIMHAFYPLMLNTAKRSRTTVEALELRGYRYAASSKAVKKIKLASLKVTYNDLLFLAVSFLWMTAALLASTLAVIRKKVILLRLDFHTHGKLAKKLPFSTVYTDWLFDEARRAGWTLSASPSTSTPSSFPTCTVISPPRAAGWATLWSSPTACASSPAWRPMWPMADTSCR